MTSPDLCINSSDVNLMRLALLTRKVGSKYAKQIIFKHFPKDPILLYNALVPYKKNLGNLYQDQYQILFDTTTLGTNIDECDLTLLGKILRLKNDPNSNNMEDLLKARNWIAHPGSTPIPIQLYTQKFNDAKAILKRLGANDAEIEYFRHARIDNSQKIIEDLLKDIRNELPRSIVLREALHIVCKDIEDGWRDLAISLDIDVHVVDGIAQENITNEEKMNKCFECKSFNISWNHLKQKLIMQNREHIVGEIIKHTYITTGLKELSNGLQNHYKSRLEHVQATDPCSKWPLTSIPRMSQYINLYMSNDIGKKDSKPNSDRKFNLNNQFNLRKKIEMQDILKNDSDDFVLIQGIGGIGKSTLADLLVLQWSSKELLHDIKLLFYIKCREIEKLEEETLKDFAINYFASLCDERTFVDYKDIIGKHVLFMFDGVDELESTKLSKLSDMLTKNFCKPSEGFRVCVTGRPNAIQQVMLNDKLQNLKLIDLMGLAPENQKSFIEKQYHDRQDKEQMVSEMIKIIESNPELKSLATIPLYLQILCYIYDQGNGLEDVTSSISANLVVCLYIIQNCHKELGLSNVDLHNVACHKKVVQIMIELGKISSLSNHPVSSDMEKCGVLVKYGSTKKGFGFHFQHLIFSEFFCGLYLFSKSRSEIYDIFMNLKFDSSLWNSLPTLIAFHTTMSQVTSFDSLVHSFLKEVVKEARWEQLLDRHIDWLLVKLFACQFHYEAAASYYFLKWHVASNRLPKFVEKLFKLVLDSVVINDSWWTLLESICESNRKVPSLLIDAVNGADKIKVCIGSRQMLSYVSRVFSTEHKLLVCDKLISLEIVKDVLTDEDLECMKPLIIKSKLILIIPNFNVKLFISLLTDEKENVHEGFVKLKTLIMTYLPRQLIDYLPNLQTFRLVGCNHIPEEFAPMLLSSFIRAELKRTLLLDDLVLSSCSNQVVDTMLPCVLHIKSLIIHECIISPWLWKHLSSLIANRSWNFLKISFTNCNVTDHDIFMLSSCFSNIRILELSNNPDISEMGIKKIANSIQRQVDVYGIATLRMLFLSHFNGNLLKVLLPIIPYLLALEFTHSKFDVKDLKLMRDKMQNREEKFLLMLSEDVGVDKRVVHDIFKGLLVELVFV